MVGYRQRVKARPGRKDLRHVEADKEFEGYGSTPRGAVAVMNSVNLPVLQTDIESESIAGSKRSTFNFKVKDSALDPRMALTIHWREPIGYRLPSLAWYMAVVMLSVGSHQEGFTLRRST